MAASLARCQSDCAQDFHPARDALEMEGLLLKVSAPRCKILAGHHDNVLTQSGVHDNVE
jgi:hypothetical protein